MSDTSTVRVGSDFTTVIASGTIGPPGPPGPAGPSGPPATSNLLDQIIFSKEGDLVVEAGSTRYRVIGSQTVLGVYISVGTEPVGDDLIVDVNVNGSSIFTSSGSQPTIPDGTNTSGLATPAVTTLSDSDYITVDVDQVGSTTPGSDLTVQILLGEGDTHVALELIGIPGPIGPMGIPGPTGPAGADGVDGATGPTGPRGIGQAYFGMYGNVVTLVGTSRWRVVGSQTIIGVVINCGTAPVGADIIVDVNLNGTTVFTTQANRPRIVVGNNESSVAIPDVTSLPDGSHLTVDVDQVGSTTPGADLTVQIILQ